MHPAFSQTDHRPWALPDKPWILTQSWINLLFLHWEIEYQDLRRRIPEHLEIDLFDGKAWIAVVPFDMRGVALRGLPKIPAISDFPEINVRSYVIHDGKPGVWFFSLDVPSRFAAWTARTFFHLPYRHGQVDVEETRGSRVRYASQVDDDLFQAAYEPLSAIDVGPRSFERWATERYCLYCANKGKVYRTEVQHQRWPLQSARIDIAKNTMLKAYKIRAAHPSVLFSKSIDVVAYPPERIA